MPINKKLSLLPILGLDPVKPANYIDDRATPNCENISIDRYVIRKRMGASSLGSSASERILAYRELYVSSVYNLLRVGLTKVESMNYTTGAWTDRANAALTADSDVYRVDTALPILSGAKILTFTNYKDNIRKWVGGANDDADLGGSPPKAKYMVDYAGYLVLAYIDDGVTVRPMRVQWSDTGDPETWTGGNTGSVDLTEDGQDITGIEIFSNYIAVHKESCIYIGYLVTTSSIFQFDRKNTGVGTICFATIQNLPTGEQAFLARDGIHLFNGISAPLVNSPAMEELIEAINPSEIHKCWSVIVKEKNEYWVGIPIGSNTEPTTVYKYNYKTGQCHKDKLSNMTAAGMFTESTQETWADVSEQWNQYFSNWDNIGISSLFPNIIYGNSSGISSKRDNVNNDISTAIEAFWESKDYEDEQGRFARWQRMQVWAKGNNLKIEYSVNEGVNWTLITTLSLGSSYPSDDSPLFVYFDVVSTKIRFRFSNSTADETFYLKQFIVEYTKREMR